MKTNFFTLLLLFVVAIPTLAQRRMFVHLKDGTIVTYFAENIKSITWDSRNWEVKDHECIDLGLPSGTLWATCNVGANSPEEFGDYFAWAETEPKDVYNDETYKYMAPGYSDSKGYNKYTIPFIYTWGCWYDGNKFIGDNKDELEVYDDAAYMNWGPDWRTPSYNQMLELVDESYTTISSYYYNGVLGTLIKSKINGAFIFLPNTGYRSNDKLADYPTYYWSRSLGSNTIWIKVLQHGTITETTRGCGYPVRPVRNTEP